MACRESRLVEFVFGELDVVEERRFDEHLLDCEACWRAVREDRAGRIAAMGLRSIVPVHLGDRLRWSVALVANRSLLDSPWRRSHRRRRVMAGVLAVSVALGAIGVALAGRSVGDPPLIAAIVGMLQPRGVRPALSTGERMVVAGQSIEVRLYVVQGKDVIAATSARSFAMPVGSHLMPGSSTHAWMASSGSVSLYGVNGAGPHAESMLVVASMPMEQLPEIAARLRLI